MQAIAATCQCITANPPSASPVCDPEPVHSSMRLSCHSQVCNIGYRCQCLPTEAKGVDAGEVLILLQLGGGEALAQQWEVVSLPQQQLSIISAGHESKTASLSSGWRTYNNCMGMFQERLTLMPCPLSCICSNLLPPSLTITLIIVEPAKQAACLATITVVSASW